MEPPYIKYNVKTKKLVRRGGVQYNDKFDQSRSRYEFLVEVRYFANFRQKDVLLSLRRSRNCKVERSGSLFILSNVVVLSFVLQVLALNVQSI